MDIAILGLKICMQDQGEIFEPYQLVSLDSDPESKWGFFEKLSIKSTMGEIVPEKVDSMFNHWTITKTSGIGWFAHRSTWNMSSLHSDSLKGLSKKIKEYYENNK